MRLGAQRRLAAELLGCSAKRVRFDSERLEEVKEAITKFDIKGLIKDKAIARKPEIGISRGRARKRHLQKRAGRKKGFGRRKGRKQARTPKKATWIKKVRTQRAFIKDIREKNIIKPSAYQHLYNKTKGGFFRSKKHIKLYMEERGFTKK